MIKKMAIDIPNNVGIVSNNLLQNVISHTIIRKKPYFRLIRLNEPEDKFLVQKRSGSKTPELFKIYLS